jgi:hypothetical protein
VNGTLFISEQVSHLKVANHEEGFLQERIAFTCEKQTGLMRYQNS